MTALIGAALGIPLGIVLALLIGEAINFARSRFRTALIVFVIAAVIAGIVAAIFPARRASRLNVLAGAPVRVAPAYERAPEAGRLGRGSSGLSSRPGRGSPL